MAGFSVQVNHTLGIDECRRRVQVMLASLKQKHRAQLGGLRESWRGDRGEFSVNSGIVAVSGNVVLSDRQVSITGDAPWLLKSRIQDAIQQELRRLLN